MSVDISLTDDLRLSDKTIKVTAVKGSDTPNQPMSISYEGDNGNPYKPGKSVLSVLWRYWGADSQAYVGRSITLFYDQTVTYGGLEIGGIRIRHLSHMPDVIPMVSNYHWCEECECSTMSICCTCTECE